MPPIDGSTKQEAALIASFTRDEQWANGIE